MIKVKKNKNKIMISGHAMYDIEGKDIVCASVSTLIVTTVNAIIKVDEEAISYTSKKGNVQIEIQKENETVKLLIQNMMDLFYELEKQYQKNIKIEEVSS